jgi:RNA polymerase sigma-70 factor, ECF subfamily
MADNNAGIEAMIRMARDNDSAALGRLLENYRSYMRILAQRQIGGPLARRVDASDVVQQSFLEAQRDFQRFLGVTEPELVSWLTRILDHNLAETIRNHALTAKRAVGREQPLGRAADATIAWHELSAAHSSPSQRAMKGEEAIRLARALETLPSDQREAVRLRHLEGWSLEQIAEHLDKSLAAAAGLIKRGVQNLRDRLASQPSSEL